MSNLLLPLLASAALALPTPAQQTNINVGNGFPSGPAQLDVLNLGVPVDIPFASNQSVIIGFDGSPIDLTLDQGGLTFQTTLTPPTAGDSYSVVAHFDASGTPRFSTFLEDRSPLQLGGPGRVVARHLAAFGAVDVRLVDAGGAVAATFSSLSNAQDASADVAPADYTLEVLPAGGSTVVLSTPVTVESGFLRILSIVGSPADQLGVLDVMIERRETVFTFGPSCGGASASYFAGLDPDGSADLAFVLFEVPVSGTAFLLAGVSGAPIDLGLVGAPGCELGVDPFAVLPLTQFGSTAFFDLSLPPAVAASAPVLAWQFVYTGESNPLGIGAAETALTFLN